MAWTSPMTAVAGVALAAANWNAHVRDNLKALLPLDIVAWTSYTPTFTQSGAVSKTVTYAKYQQIGKIVTVRGLLVCTGSGTANALITIGLPVTAATTTDVPCGTGYIKTTSWFPGLATTVSTTTIALIDATASTGSSLGLGQTGTAASGALASTNQVGFFACYEAA